MQTLEWQVEEKTTEVEAVQEQLRLVEERQNTELGTLKSTLQVLVMCTHWHSCSALIIWSLVPTVSFGLWHNNWAYQISLVQYSAIPLCRLLHDPII